MRIATLILGLVFTLLIFMAGLSGLALSIALPKDADRASYGLSGAGSLVLVDLLFLLGSAFVLAKPRFAALLFLAASLVSMPHFFTGPTLGHPLWMIVGLVLAGLGFLGRNETRQIHQLSS